MPIDSTHPSYDKNKDKWKLVRDVIESNVCDYVIPPEYGNSERVLKRNANYIARAIFDNYTVNTKLGLVGTALQKNPNIELPPGMEYMEDSATGNNLTLRQLIRKLLGENIEVGRVGILSDYPAVPMGLSQAQVRDMDLKPKMYVYKAEDILNWDTDKSTGSERLSFVVLREEVKVRVDGYKWGCDYQYRVMQLDENGYYNYFIADKQNKLSTDIIYPRQNGSLMKHIPFVIIGAEDNDNEVDNSPLYPIAHVNIGHLRNSASYEDNLDAHAQGTLFLTSDLSYSQWKEMTETRPVVMGSREGYFLGTNGKADLVQLQAGQELANAMSQKEEQMIMMGASLITQSAANAPVETTRMVMGAKVSRLDTIVTNVESGVTAAVKECCLFAGTNPELVMIELSHDFIPEQANPSLMQQLAAQWQAGIIPQRIVLDYNKKVGLIADQEDNDQLISESQNENPIDMTVPVDNTTKTSNNGV